MRNFKRFIGIISLSVVALASVNYLHSERDGASVVEAEIVVNSLTGLPGSDGPILVVKIDDTRPAHPQVGLRDADVVYIEQVEGGLTRLAAVYSSKIPQVIGPVRSARISDIELLAQYGKVAFAYSGAQKKLLPVIAEANLLDVGANRFGPTYYANDVQRNAPYAMMVQAEKLLDAGLSRDPEVSVSKSMGWNFGARSPLSQRFTSVEFSWPASKYTARWSKSEQRWLLFFNGEPNLDSNGYHLGPANLVVQLVSITDSIYSDRDGGVTPFSATVGEGRCYLLRNARALPCLWSRVSEEDGTTFTDRAGQPIFFDAGQSWFALTDREPIFSGLQSQDAAKSTNK